MSALLEESTTSRNESEVQNDEGLTSLLHISSQLASSDLPSRELIERVGSLALYTLRAESLSIILRDAENGAFEEFSDRRRGPQGDARSFVFSRPIAVRGQQFGHLEITVSDAKWPVALLLAVAETLLALLALRAELADLCALSAAKREELEQLRHRRRIEILLSRATGIVAAQRNSDIPSARKWLAEEAAHRNVALSRLAERLILSHVLDRRLAPARPGLPLRRTA